MPVTENGNHNEARKPIDHLRAFIASVAEPQGKKEESAPEENEEQAQRKPFRGRDIAQGNGEDKTVKFIFAGAGGVVVLVLMILSLSQKHVAKKPRADAPPFKQAHQQLRTQQLHRAASFPRSQCSRHRRRAGNKAN